MAINLPNRFACTTRTALIDGPTVDLRPFTQPGIPADLVRQLVCDRFLLSISQVVSAVNSETDIEFSEALLKVPVEIAGTRWLFPVAAWVTHEYSLIRGYLLGFNKYFVPASSTPSIGAIVTQDLEADLGSGHLTTPLSEDDLPEEHGRPFLLWTDFSVGSARSHGFHSLDVVDYRRHSLDKVSVPRNVGRVFDRQLVAAAAYEIRDSFTVTGLTPFHTPSPALHKTGV